MEQRLWSNINMTSECWVWEGGQNAGGYGVLRINNKTRGVHRLIYELLVGPIPEGLVLDHLCRIPSCVNPDHLEIVTHKTNILRGVGPTAVNANKTHCIHGHEFNEENTYRVKSTNHRKCKMCCSIRQKNRKLVSQL